MKKHKNNKNLTLAMAFVLGCCVFGASDAFAEEAATRGELAFDLEGITVEAARPDWETKLSPGSVTVIRPDDYKGEQKTLPDLMRKVPGVHVREVNGKGQYTTVTVRGSTAAQVGVFIDGVLSNLGGDAAADLSTIPVDNVERIEVYRGYIPARFPGTYIGGVINIVTKRPDKADVSVELGTSSYGGQKGAVEVTAPLGDGSLMFGTNYESSDGDFKYKNYAAEINAAQTQQKVNSLQQQVQGYIDKGITSGSAYENAVGQLNDAKKQLSQETNNTRWRKYNDYENTNSILKWQNDEWMVKAAWNKVDRHLPDSLWLDGSSTAPTSNGVDVFDNYKYDSRRQTIDTKELLLQNRKNVGKLEWGWMLDYTKSDKEYRAEHIHDEYEADLNVPMREWSRYESDKYNAQIDGTYKLADNNMLDFQVNFSKERMDVDGSLMDGKLSSEMEEEEWNKFFGQYRNRYEQEMLNVQLQDTITLDKKATWHLTPSVKYNRSTITGYSNGERFPEDYNGWISPKDEQTNSKTTWQIGLKKEFSDNFTMRMTGGTYYRLLNMYEIAGDGAGILPAPNDNGTGMRFPVPEEGKQFDISALWHGKTLGAEARTTLTYFWRDSDNMLQLQRYGKDYWCYMNDSKGTARGIELQSSFNWNKLDLDLQATYTKTDAKKRNSATAGGYDWLDVYQTYQPEWEGNARLTYNAQSDIALFAEAHYTDKYYTNSIDVERFALPVDDLLTFNAGVKLKTRSNWEVTVGCNDLFDDGPKMKIRSINNDGYINPEYPIQGRTFYITAKYDF